jgi:putative transposase
VAGSFFQLLKRERFKQNIYTTKQDFYSDVFDRIEMIYNPQRLHDLNNPLSSVEFEKHYVMRQGSVWKIRGDSVYSFLKPVLVLDCAELCGS